MDEKKVEAIKNRPIPTSVKEVQAFVGLASFYRKFIHNFGTIASTMTDCLKKGTFLRGNKQQDNFELLKEKLSNNPVLKLLDFSQPFEVVVDACRSGI
ncbi:wall-associated receptor kinase 5-like [Cucumis melo var. makuwa]|uniref:Wall-associated receptor kinase 5-like n=1 Tax=Cucumis melo var. makuwa TaxID=1194695 RepID=A0A5D3DBL1_CUCMM|nr:wall-associated receptor kinase 5-like [Cucumis melo var. makuwa]